MNDNACNVPEPVTVMPVENNYDNKEKIQTTFTKDNLDVTYLYRAQIQVGSTVIGDTVT